ncbi:ependymin-2-like [Xiphophorus maculatus]|uniref:Ependymin-2-like n=1 Tax=Xiphophorus maculatus TaxID=8083 RepID=A0A3B5R5V9_XIPMA|nr:ependymin-2-like [Xiphophorus maculatus]
MRLPVLLTCLLAACLAKAPHPCESPPLLTGALTVSTQNEKLFTFAKYLYDALGRRVRLLELGTYENKTFTYDVLLHYREATMYEIHSHNRTCKKMPLKVEFYPLSIPKDATLLGQVVVGSSSGPGQGLLVNSWMGDLPDKSGKYLSVVTEFGCIPVSTNYQTKEYGWMLMSFFDNVIGIEDPNLLNVPSFCSEGEGKEEQTEPVDFFNLFQNKK